MFQPPSNPISELDTRDHRSIRNCREYRDLSRWKTLGSLSLFSSRGNGSAFLNKTTGLGGCAHLCFCSEIDRHNHIEPDPGGFAGTCFPETCNPTVNAILDVPRA